jgi:hypothetical protein
VNDGIMYDEINRAKRPFIRWEVIGHFWIPVGELPPDRLEQELIEKGATIFEYGAVMSTDAGDMREWFALRSK